MTLLLALLACGGADPVETGSATAETTTPATTPSSTPPDDPTPWVYEETDEPTPDFSATEVEGAIAGAVALAFELNASPVIDSYDHAMDGQGAVCPSYYAAEDGSLYWYDYCTAETGASFNGYGFSYVYDDYYDPASGATYNGRAVYSAATIDAHDGYSFSGAGSATWLDVTSGTGADELRYFYSLVAGSFAWDGPEAAGTWLETGEVQPDVEMTSYLLPYYDVRVTLVDGGVSGLGGEIDTVVFDYVAMWDALLTTSGCDIEPSGTISVRTPEGDWYDVLFDGPVDENTYVDPADCDGCGQAWFRGEEVGEVCADFSALLNWGDQPW